MAVEPVEKVTSTSRHHGELLLTSSRLCFVGQNGWTAAMDDIEAVDRRRYQLQEVGLEVFLASGEAHLLVFSSRASREALLSLLHSQGVPNPQAGTVLVKATRLWRQGNTSNFTYLMQLNR